LAFLAGVDEKRRDEILEGVAAEFNDASDADTLSSAFSLLYEFVEDYQARDYFAGVRGEGEAFEKELGRAVSVYHARKLDDQGRYDTFFYESADVEIQPPAKMSFKDVDEKIQEGRYHDMNREELLRTVRYLSSISEAAGDPDNQSIQSEVDLTIPAGSAARPSRSTDEKEDEE